MAKRKKSSKKSKNVKASRAPIERGGMTPERRSQAAKSQEVIKQREGGGESFLDWVDKMYEAGHIDQSTLSTFRKWLELKDKAAQGVGSADYEKPRVQTSGAADAFNIRYLDAHAKLKDLWDRLIQNNQYAEGKITVTVLERLIGAKSSQDFSLRGIPKYQGITHNQEKLRIATNALSKLDGVYAALAKQWRDKQDQAA